MSPDESGDHWRAQLHRRIDCPVPWCTGFVLDHGGNGADPDNWRHSDDGTDLAYGAALYRSQHGARPVVWEMVAGGTVVAVGGDLAQLAVRLQEIAEAVAVLGNLEQ